MLSSLLLVLGVLALTFALRSYAHPWAQKLGALGILVSTYLTGALLSGSRWVGVALAACWFLLPWLDLITRVRKLKLPLERNLRERSPPNTQDFPALPDLTEEIESEKFEYLHDAGWDWEDYQQFFRLFYKTDERLQAAVCLIDQKDIVFYYLVLSSRAKDGTLWTTWNYPFSYSLKLAPQWRVNRLRGEQSFLLLLESHRAHLQRHGISVDLLEGSDARNIYAEMQKDLQAQVTHNLSEGVLVESGQSEVRYTWRGLVFLWLQFLRDLVRLV